MTKIATAYSKNRSAQKAARACVETAFEKAGISQCGTLLFFVTPHYRRRFETLLQTLKEASGAKVIAGSSAYGVLTEEIEIENEQALAVLAIQSDEFNTDSFFLSNLQESSFRAGEAAALRISESAVDPSAMILLSDPYSFQGQPFLEALESRRDFIPISGSLSSENGKLSRTYQFHENQYGCDAVSALLFSKPLRFETGLAKTCQPFGTPLKITRAEGNRIYEMEGRPAYDIFLETISQIPYQDPTDLLQRVFLGLPSQSFQTDFHHSPYFIRNIMAINSKKGMLTCVSPVEEGEFVTFTLRNADFARASMKDMLRDLGERVNPEELKLGLYFNSCGRGKNLYREPNVDIGLIRKKFPGLPLLGMMGYGEMAPVDYINHLHHYSGVLTLGSLS